MKDRINEALGKFVETTDLRVVGAVILAICLGLCLLAGGCGSSSREDLNVHDARFTMRTIWTQSSWQGDVLKDNQTGCEYLILSGMMNGVAAAVAPLEKTCK